MLQHSLSRLGNAESGHASFNRLASSFRDPSGFVYRHGGEFLRQLNPSAMPGYDLLMRSGLYEELTRDGLLIPHVETDLHLAFNLDAVKVLHPEQLAFVSYPYEWCFSMLKDAGLRVLEIQRRALRRGLSLKDASAYNMQLHNGRLLHIDTLSFEPYEEGKPWVAYRQFCQHFLAPLALSAYCDVRLSQLMRVYIDGIPLDLASALLPWHTRFTLGMGLHIHAHARAQAKHAATAATKVQPSSVRLSKKQQEALLEGLRMSLEKLGARGGTREWSNYYEANNNYGEQGLDHKAQMIKELLSKIKPNTVWDLGGNTGRFSRLAIDAGATSVVCWDVDMGAVERSYAEMKRKQEKHFLPLLLDLTNPSNDLGWAGNERLSLSSRAPVDVVMALGLVHHLAISNNVPLSDIAAYFASLGRNVVVEWVPKEDSQVKKLLATRQDIFDHYTQADFEEAFAAHFPAHRAALIPGTCRTLYQFGRIGI